MRKTKRICVRCRFYKSGVSSFIKLHQYLADDLSVTRVTLAKNAIRSRVMRVRFVSPATENISKTQAWFAAVRALSLVEIFFTDT